MRPSPDELAAAVEAGVLQPIEAERLRVFIEGRRLAETGGGPTREDTEQVRFARGFHDVFMSVGLGVLLFGVRYAALSVPAPHVAALAFAGAAIACWLLAELFARRQKLVLPSVVLAIAFSGFAAHAVAALLAVDASPKARVGVDVVLAMTIAATVAAAAFRLRFRLPFSSLLIGAGLVGTALGCAALVAPDFVASWFSALLLAAGLAAFAAAMRFDMRDVTRETLASDNGFWLHLLAAPLIVHSLLSIVTPRLTDMGGWQAGFVILVVMALAYVAIVVDRRALLMSGLLYLGGAVGTLIAKADLGALPILAMTLVIIGSFVTALGAVWRPARRFALGFAPDRLRPFVPSTG